MACIICNSINSKRLYSNLIKCLNCGFVWADIDTNKLDIKKIYDDNYFYGEEYANYLEEKEALQKNFKRNLKLISKFVPSGKLLEIGCAYGFFLELAQKQYEVQGIDINENACKYAKEKLNLNVVCGDFLELEFQENYYDVIVMWATLEHLKEPHLYIEKISKLLKKEGIFACSTLDIESLLARIQKNKWRQIHLPTHLSYFSKKTLKHILNKYNLNPIFLAKLGEYRTINNALYIILKNKFIKLYNWIKILKLNKGIFYLNTFDTIYIIAHKS